MSNNYLVSYLDSSQKAKEAEELVRACRQDTKPKLPVKMIISDSIVLMMMDSLREEYLILSMMEHSVSQGTTHEVTIISLKVLITNTKSLK